MCPDVRDSDFDSHLVRTDPKAQDGDTMMDVESLSAKVQPHVLWNNMDEWGAMVDKVRNY